MSDFDYTWQNERDCAARELGLSISQHSSRVGEVGIPNRRCAAQREWNEAGKGSKKTQPACSDQSSHAQRTATSAICQERASPGVAAQRKCHRLMPQRKCHTCAGQFRFGALALLCQIQLPVGLSARRFLCEIISHMLSHPDMTASKVADILHLSVRQVFRLKARIQTPGCNQPCAR